MASIHPRSLGRDAEQLAQHRDRQRARVPAEQVDGAAGIRAACAASLQQARGGLLGERPQRGAARRERAFCTRRRSRAWSGGSACSMCE